MADYKKMYTILCGAVDEVIDPLEQIPMAREAVQVLREALLQAESVYIDTAALPKMGEQTGIVELYRGGTSEPHDGV